LHIDLFLVFLVRLIGEFRDVGEYQFELAKNNVDALKLIQLGLTFMDDKGNLPPTGGTWQFNFSYTLENEMYAQDSIEMLKRSGVDFERCETEGIDHIEFTELFITSGILMSDDITWITFHGQYDICYVLRMIRNENMSREFPLATFYKLMKNVFPVLFDIKYVIKSCKNLSGSLGLQDVADLLGVTRIGPKHQAGSDALLTGSIFFKLKELYFEGSMDEEKYCGHIYGFPGSYYMQD